MGREIPKWYRDAKLGIMVHWGLPAIPAFAPARNGSMTDILAEHGWPYYFRNNPYAEWYLNSLRLGQTDTHRFHNRRFNRAYPYERLAERFNDDIRPWDPAEWAELFAETGARYVVMVAKHHDGFLLWPSKHPPAREGYIASRDIVGELADAVRERSLRFGVYYSGLLDWTVQAQPIADFGDILTVDAARPYAEYVERHFAELIERYRPDVLWNDIGLPRNVSRRDLFRRYRNTVADGVLNDRWMQVSRLASRLLSRGRLRRRAAEWARNAIVAGKPLGNLGDVATVEYGQTTGAGRRPWEAVRSIGNSFAYNEQEDPSNSLTGIELAWLLADVVSRNGNLLLNVGPKSDGTIPAGQRSALVGLAEWLRTNGEAIFGTRPWNRPSGETGDGIPVRYTTGRDALYVILRERPKGLTLELPNIPLRSIPRDRREPGVEDELTISLFGCDRPIQWTATNGRVEISLPGSFVPTGPIVVALTWRAVSTRARQIELYTDVIG